MKIELCSVGDKDGEKIREFLVNNNLPFREIVTSDSNPQDTVEQTRIDAKKSLLKIIHSHSIHIIDGFNEFALNQLLEHIQKYKPKIAN